MKKIILSFILLINMLNCQTVIYNIDKKPKPNLDDYTELNFTQRTYLFFINRTHVAFASCGTETEEDEKNMIKPTPNGRPPKVIITKYNFGSSVFNLFIGLLRQTREIYIYCE